jgi:hypothetical protein
VPLRILLKNKKYLARDTRIALHLGFALHELRAVLAHFAHLYNFNRTHALLNCPPSLRQLLPILPDLVYDYFLPTNVIICRK